MNFDHLNLFFKTQHISIVKNALDLLDGNQFISIEIENNSEIFI